MIARNWYKRFIYCGNKRNKNHHLDLFTARFRLLKLSDWNFYFEFIQKDEPKWIPCSGYRWNILCVCQMAWALRWILIEIIIERMTSFQTSICASKFNLTMMEYRTWMFKRPYSHRKNYVKFEVIFCRNFWIRESTIRMSSSWAWF